MPLDMPELLTDLERDLELVKLAPAADIRARGSARRRHQALGGALAVAVVLGVVGIGVAGLMHPPAQISDATPATSATASNGVAVTVYLTVSATPAQKQAIEEYLRTLPLAGAVHFQNRNEAWARFIEQFKDHPDLIAATNPEVLPELFKLTLVSRDDLAKVRAQLQTMPGVEQVGAA